ncbi:MAG: hypothetical protein ACFFCW_17305 [Candidatus Hodarchaeota archaeon]
MPLAHDVVARDHSEVMSKVEATHLTVYLLAMGSGISYYVSKPEIGHA